MLHLEHVGFRYPRRSAAALCDVSLAVGPGETTAVLGLSGSGKTTLLNLMSLLWDRRLAEGRIVYAVGDKSYEYGRLSADAMAALRRDHFGFVLQSSYLLPHFSCADNVAVPLALQRVPPAAARARVERLLRDADPSGGLSELAGRSAREVSGGEKQRIAILRAVVHDPRVLFADEPLSNLDFRNAGYILDLLRRWKAGHLNPDGEHTRRNLVLVTHDVPTAFDLADRFVLLRHGRLLADPAKTDLSGPDDLRKRLDG